MANTNYHMPWSEFRRQGKAMIDRIADYYESVEDRSVLAQVAPGDIRAKLPSTAPESGEPFERVIEDIERIIMPGITHWQSPNFFAYFPSNTSGPSILGELLSAGLGVQGMLWATSPACTELEAHVLDWVVDLLGLPRAFKSTEAGGGVIQDSASSATLCAVVAARARLDGNVPLDRLRVYATEHTHSSLEKGMRIAGLPSSSLRKVATDKNGAMLANALDEAITRDLESGNSPCLVCATLGTTSSNAMDRIDQIGPVCQSQGVWLHVDAAMSGSAMVCPEFRSLQNGVEFADSYCFNPHKWLFTNFDCDCLFVKDRQPLINALSILPEYLRNRATDAGEVFDYRDWQIPLGRRFRALKLWFVLRHYGTDGLRHHIREHVSLAKRFAAWVEEHPDFEVAAPTPLNLVCFRHRLGDDFGRALLESLNASGRLYLTHTSLDDRYTLRLCVGQAGTRDKHVRAAWDFIVAKASELEGTE